MTSQEEMAGLPTHTQFRLLKKSIPEAILMTKVFFPIIYDLSHIRLLIVEVWGFNVADVDYELSLVLTDTDMQQFR